MAKVGKALLMRAVYVHTQMSGFFNQLTFKYGHPGCILMWFSYEINIIFRTRNTICFNVSCAPNLKTVKIRLDCH